MLPRAAAALLAVAIAAPAAAAPAWDGEWSDEEGAVLTVSSGREELSVAGDTLSERPCERTWGRGSFLWEEVSAPLGNLLPSGGADETVRVLPGASALIAATPADAPRAILAVSCGEVGEHVVPLDGGAGLRITIDRADMVVRAVRRR